MEYLNPVELHAFVTIRLSRVLLWPPSVQRRGSTARFCGFTPAVSASSMKAMRQTIRDLKLRRQTQLSLQDIARKLNLLLRGWIEYNGRYTPSALYSLYRYVIRLSWPGQCVNSSALSTARLPRVSSFNDWLRLVWISSHTGGSV